MDQLISSMVNANPDERPSMEKVVAEFQKILTKLPGWRLRSRLVARKDGFFTNLHKDVYHIVYRAVPHLFHRRQPLPSPKISGGP